MKLVDLGKIEKGAMSSATRNNSTTSGNSVANCFCHDLFLLSRTFEFATHVSLAASVMALKKSLTVHDA